MQVVDEVLATPTPDGKTVSSPLLIKDSEIIPTCHQHTTNKQGVWRLQVEKRSLMIGDSNLAKITGCEEEDVQIDSFPGGSFHHVESILSDVSVNHDVKNVVLSFGINSRAWAPAPHTYNNIDRAFQTCKDKFPKAEIWAQLINYSRGIPTQEQDNLELINTYIREKHDYIPKIGRTQFSVGPDKIHWTPATATNMFNHWLSFMSWN